MELFVESFPAECKHVLEVIANVYKHDADSHALGHAPEAMASVAKVKLTIREKPDFVKG